MRLYLKLVILVLSAALLQRYVLDNGVGRDGWFVARCAVAGWTGDQEMRAALVEEGRIVYYGGVAEEVYVNAGGGGAFAG
jgi:hypothetical protein